MYISCRIENMMLLHQLARQWGLIFQTAFFGLDCAGLVIDAPAVTVVRFLQRDELAGVVQATGQISSEELFTAELLFDVFEATSAVGCVGFLSLNAGLGVDAESDWHFAEWYALFRFEVAVASALQTVHAAGFLEVHGTAWSAFGLVLLAVTGATALGLFLASIASRFLEDFSGETIHTPALTGGTVMLGRGEETVFVAGWSIASDHTSAQSHRALFVAWWARWIVASGWGFGALDFLAVIGVDAPAVAGGSVALHGFVEAEWSASWHVFARHFLTKLLPCLIAWSRALQARSSNGESRQREK